MLDIYTKDGWLPITNRKNYYTTYEYDGTHKLYFDISPDDDMYQYIANEVSIRNQEGLYLIKDINKRSAICTVTCNLDMDDWLQNEPYLATKELPIFQTKTLSAILESIKPTGWTIINAGIRDIKRTPEIEDASNYDVLIKCQEIFNVVYEIRNNEKEIRVIDPDFIVDKGVYITPQLNLKSVSMSGDSTSFATRITAYGKKNEDNTYVNFAAINNGKTYVEDNTYANKQHPIWIVWKDERYTVPESLLQDAKKKLKEQAYPVMSFEVSVNDLSQTDERYSFLKLGLYDIAHVIVDENTEIIEKVIKIQRYHDTPDKDKITLSSEPQTITGKVNDAISILGEDGQRISGSILQQAQEKATQLINQWAEKGYVYQTDSEIYIMDSDDKEKAKYVIRMNLGGIAFSQNGWRGPYISAWTIDGKFNADFITAGTIKGLKLIGNDITGNTISGGTINGSTISGGTITGGTITGETEIRVGTDLYVGDNIYLGNPENEYGKSIILNKNVSIYLSQLGFKLKYNNSCLSINREVVSVTSTMMVENSLYVDGNSSFKNNLIIYGTATIKNGTYIYGTVFCQNDVSIAGKLNCTGDATIYGNLKTIGEKNRLVKTASYGDRLMNAVESAAAVFEDIGTDIIGEDGFVTVFFDEMFLETISISYGYQIFLTPLNGECKLIEKHDKYFKVKGTPGASVDWRITAKQKGYETVRMKEDKDVSR